MSNQPVVPPVALLPSSGRLPRVEYLGFQDVGGHREFRLRVYGREGSSEFRFAIAIAAFAAGRVSRQDGPDVCYQKLLRAVAAGEPATSDVITIDDVELASFREAHTHVPKRRPRPPQDPLSMPTPPPLPRPRVMMPSRRPLAPLPVVAPPAPGLEEGQRVSHAIFGVGVTIPSGVGHTAVCFDAGGKKTFVSSMLEVDVLSEPHTWETGARGVNRLRRAK